ncbi:Plasmodium exported protein, unknown function [Plasmodium knowlesi strain H]|uniref:Pv-fam-d protein n=3 Tax=Plasmodium knowlesi TaxID=5850 RepID=A0A1A7W4F4_PLAKH|nr:Plasmodium exported protein, unknown function [Plasmodium knowlesi strain H]OTN64969.1 Uncharacterized protein PKNOH_S120118900 [Plasmodium knowlesi]CAA9988057.1 Plasmodium exported protein, unknown function [Plasmodium knowlesi strain H]SBO19911.1 Plasmodium exported protein, unknown function [Plasmodium knowlesi strain H]SBO29061.1 Plasmodium exported protein, unknown function [Plasmodium knowlesi strain H]VVS77531.1 Plasmodium exported protein, unknown function [Plasmodium knowlesi strai
MHTLSYSFIRWFSLSLLLWNNCEYVIQYNFEEAWNDGVRWKNASNVRCIRILKEEGNKSVDMDDNFSSLEEIMFGIISGDEGNVEEGTKIFLDKEPLMGKVKNGVTKEKFQGGISSLAGSGQHKPNNVFLAKGGRYAFDKCNKRLSNNDSDDYDDDDDYDEKYENRKYEDRKYENGKYENRKYENRKYEDRKYENGKYGNGKYENEKYKNGKYENRKYEDRKYENGKYGNGKYENEKYKNGKYENRKYEDRKYENGKYGNGKYENEKYKNGKYENRKYKNGKYEDRKYENGKYENGKYENEKYKNGKYENGKYENGKYENGKYENEKYKNGKYENGKYENGKYKNGKYENRKYENKKYEEKEEYDYKYGDGRKHRPNDRDNCKYSYDPFDRNDCDNRANRTDRDVRNHSHGGLYLKGTNYIECRDDRRDQRNKKYRNTYDAYYKYDSDEDEHDNYDSSYRKPSNNEQYTFDNKGNKLPRKYPAQNHCPKQWNDKYENVNKDGKTHVPMNLDDSAKKLSSLLKNNFSNSEELLSNLQNKTPKRKIEIKPKGLFNKLLYTIRKKKTFLHVALILSIPYPLVLFAFNLVAFGISYLTECVILFVILAIASHIIAGFSFSKVVLSIVRPKEKEKICQRKSGNTELPQEKKTTSTENLINQKEHRDANISVGHF